MLITFLVLSAFSSTTSRAADNTPSVPPRPKHNTPTAAIDPAALSAALSLAGKQSGTIPVMVQLTVPSTSEMHAAAGGSSTLANSTRLAEYTTVVANSQDSFANALNGSGIAYTEVRRLTAAINAVQIEVDSSKVAQIAALPGVLHVFFDHEVHVSLTTSVPFIGAPAAWQNGAGFTGTGIKIAIVDTGVDYRHADFGGTATSTFPTAKVVKGANFIADGQAIGDPQDCGHCCRTRRQCERHDLRRSIQQQHLHRPNFQSRAGRCSTSDHLRLSRARLQWQRQRFLRKFRHQSSGYRWR